MFNFLKNKKKFKKENKKETLPEYLLKNWIGVDTPTTRKNLKLHSNYFIKVVSNIRSVELPISKDNNTISIIDLDGNRTTIWLYPDGKVNLITPY